MFDRFFFRSFQAEDNLESFLVSAVASVLVIRFYLELTGYPSIGGNVFHIAHLLWGGLLMLLAIAILITFLTQSSTRIAAVIGGVGFGAFIDELGKFITRDNNYFYQPTIAIIYVLFVLLYLSVQSLDQIRSTSRLEYLVNAIELIKEGAIGNFTAQQRDKALSYLHRAKASDEITESLEKTINQFEVVPDQLPTRIQRWGARLAKVYKELIAQVWFTNAVIVAFIIKSLLSVFAFRQLIDSVSELVLASLTAIFMIAWIYEARTKRLSIWQFGVFGLLIVSLWVIVTRTPAHITWPRLSISQWGELLSSAFAGLVVVAGILEMRYSRLKAYQTFRVSVLISIFLTQFFSFYRGQLEALTALVVNLFVLVVLKYMINQEYNRHEANQ